MRRSKEELKAALLSCYETALDGLLERYDEAKDFGELEEEVAVFAEEALPVTLYELQEERKGSDFSP
jgi:hypothetical protein